MSIEDRESREELLLTALRVACDEALATGSSVHDFIQTDAPPALRTKLETDAAWCRLVRRLLTSDDSSSLEPPDAFSPAVAASLHVAAPLRKADTSTIKHER